MKKIILLIIAIILIANVNFVAANSLEGEIYSVFYWLEVNSKDGTYSDDLFVARKDRAEYESELKRMLLADFYYHSEGREINTELEFSNGIFKAPKLDKYLFNIKKENLFSLQAGNKLEPQLANYLFSVNEDDYTTGLLAELQWQDIKFKPLYLREDEDLENFQQEVEVYGMVSEFAIFTDFDFVVSGLRAVPTGEVATEQVKAQSNYSLQLEQQPVEWLEVKVDLARSETDDPDFIEKVAGNLAVLKLDFDLTPELNTEFSYYLVNELYSPLRDTEYKKEYGFRETDYKQGYELKSDYRLPLELNSVLELKHSNFYRTNSYLQALEEYQGVEDDKIREYQLGLVTETGRSYSRLFFTRERTTNQTEQSIMVPPIDEEEIDDNYNPGYKDTRTNVIHLYGRYNFLQTEDYGLNFDTRYVQERTDNKYHNYKSDLSSEIREDTVILGVNGNYYLAANLRAGFNYNIEQKRVEFKIAEEDIYSQARLQKPSLKLVYQLSENKKLKLDYQYQNYKLLDYNPGEDDEVYRYYGHNFKNNEITASINVKF